MCDRECPTIGQERDVVRADPARRPDREHPSVGAGADHDPALVGRRITREGSRHPPFGDVNDRTFARPDRVATAHETLCVRSQQRLDLELDQVDKEEAFALERAHEGPTPVGCRGDVMDRDRQDGARHRPVGPDPREERARSPPTVGHAAGELGMMDDGPAAQPGEVRPVARDQKDRGALGGGRADPRRSEGRCGRSGEQAAAADDDRAACFPRHRLRRIEMRHAHGRNSITN